MLQEPWKKYQQPGAAQAPSPYVVSGGSRQPDPRHPEEARRDAAQATLAEGQTALLPSQQRKEEAQAGLAEAQAEAFGQSDDAVKFKQKRANLDALVNQINRVEELYRQTIEPTSGMGGFLDFLPTEANRQFDAAGAGLAEQGLAAFRVPGVGAQSDTELRQFVQANKPGASDYDVTIEEKLRQLRGRVEATRKELGLPEPEWAGKPGERADASTVWLGQPETGDQVQVATGKSRMENNPAFAGVNARVNQMVKANASNREILAYLKSVGMQDRDIVAIVPQLQKVQEFKRQNPGYKGDYKVDLERWEVPNTLLERATPEASYFGNAANALSLGTLDNMTDNPGLTRAALEGLSQQSPLAALAGTVSGGALAAGGGQLAATRTGLQGGRAALAGDALFGAGYGAGSADDGNRLLGAVTGAAAGVAGGVAGRKVTSGLGRALTGTRDAATRLLTERGVPLTVGQIAGGGGRIGRGVKRIEDALESVPILGSAISARRAEGTQAFNAATFKEALEPIPPNAVTAIGEEGVEQARAATSGAYDNALSGVRVKADKIFVRDAKRAMTAGSRLHAETAEAFEKLVQNEVAPELVNGTLTGQGYQTLRRIIREERAAWKGTPRGRQYDQALRQLEGSLESLVRRKAPGIAESLTRADQAYRRTGVVRDAVSRGKNTGGTFTPAQLGMAAEANAKKFGGTQGTTQRPFFELQRAGQNILPSQVPDSGTAGRLMGAGLIPALAGAGAAGQQTGLIDPSTAGIMVALGLPFTRVGQQTLQRLMVQRPELVRSIGQQVLNRQRVGGLFGAGGGISLAAQ